MKIITIRFNFEKQQQEAIDYAVDSAIDCEIDMGIHCSVPDKIVEIGYEYDIEPTEEDIKEFMTKYNLIPEDLDCDVVDDDDFIDFLKEKYEEQAFEEYRKEKWREKCIDHSAL